MAKVDPDLVARHDQGKPYTLRYEAVNSMLLNKFLKEHKRVQEQEAAMADVKVTASKQATTISNLKSMIVQKQKEIRAITEALKAEAAQLEKLREQQLRTQAPARRVVANN